MEPKPKHLGPEYGEQFSDAAVAALYRKRPQYPPSTFDLIRNLLPASNRHVLDLGSGTGEIAIPSAAFADSVDAVELSAAMLNVARQQPGASKVRWFNQAAETFAYPRAYGLIVCAQSLHWMDWEVVFPRMATALDSDGFLVLVGLNELVDRAWYSDLRALIPRYSTNQDFVPFDLVSGLEERGLFKVIDQAQSAPTAISQSIDDYIDSLHARNGFSRDRMAPDAAAEFDDAVRALLEKHSDQGLSGEIVATVTWGKILSLPES